MSGGDALILGVWIGGAVLWALVCGWKREELLAIAAPVWWVILPLGLLALAIAQIYRAGEWLRERVNKGAST